MFLELFDFCPFRYTSLVQVEEKLKFAACLVNGRPYVI